MSPFCFVQWISEGRPLTLYGDCGHLVANEEGFGNVIAGIRRTVSGRRRFGLAIESCGVLAGSAFARVPS